MMAVSKAPWTAALLAVLSAPSAHAVGVRPAARDEATPSARAVDAHSALQPNAARTAATADCVDTDNGAMDPFGYTCHEYNSFPHMCCDDGDFTCHNYYDDGDFTSNEMCCGCERATVVSGVGDPHLSNVRGEHFDIYQPGNMVLLRLPRLAEPARTFLLVEADARRMGDVCSVYFQGVTISGTWANDSKPIQFLANPHGAPEGRHWNGWMRFGPIDLKVSRKHKGVEYLNVYARNLGHIGYEVGGLLGLDDHAAVAKRPRECARRHAAALLSSVSEVS